VKLLATLLLFLACAIPAVAGLTPAQIKAQKASHTIYAKATFEKSGCSSTAVAPYALLTASHCEVPSTTVQVDGKPAIIVAILRDDNDHSIYLLNGIGFADYVEIDEDPLSVGDEVFMFGSPGTFNGLFRKGYVMGLSKEISPQLAALLEIFGADVPTAEYYYSFMSSRGDSGAGIFDVNGKLRDVLSFGQPTDGKPGAPIVSGGYALEFTQGDFDTMRRFRPEPPPQI